MNKKNNFASLDQLISLRSMRGIMTEEREVLLSVMAGLVAAKSVCLFKFGPRFILGAAFLTSILLSFCPGSLRAVDNPCVSEITREPWDCIQPGRFDDPGHWGITVCAGDTLADAIGQIHIRNGIKERLVYDSCEGFEWEQAPVPYTVTYHWWSYNKRCWRYLTPAGTDGTASGDWWNCWDWYWGWNDAWTDLLVTGRFSIPGVHWYPIQVWAYPTNPEDRLICPRVYREPFGLYVRVVAPIVTASVSHSPAVVHEGVTFSASVDCPGEGDGEYTWQFSWGDPPQYGPSAWTVFSQPGIYTATVTYSRGGFTDFDVVTVQVGDPPPQDLTVDAGASVLISRPCDWNIDPVAIWLEPTVVDQYGRVPPNITYSWTWVGPEGGAVFDPASTNAARVNATFSKLGTYYLTVQASSGEATGEDSLLVRFRCTTPPPEDLTVYAGSDQLISLPSTVTLTPKAFGEDPENISFSWSADKPEDVTLGETSWPDGSVTISFARQGTYELTVRALSGDREDEDSLIIDVQSEPISPEFPAATSEGFDYWVTFLRGDDSSGINKLVISADGEASGIITEDIPEFSEDGKYIGSRAEVTFFQTASARPYQFYPQAYNGDPLTEGYVFEPNLAMRSAIRIQSDRPITVHGLSAEEDTTDGFLSLPTTLLGTEYVVAAHAGERLANFAIVATENGTECTINPETHLVGGQQSGEAFSVSLQAGEVIRYESFGDPIGTQITSNKPVAVLSGAPCVLIPYDFEACDTLVEQMLPVDLWGQNYFVLPLREPGDYTRKRITQVVAEDGSGRFVASHRFAGERLRIVALENDTEVSKTGLPSFILHQGEVYEEDDLSGEVSITTNNPVQVFALSEFGGDRIHVISSEDDTRVSVNGIHIPPAWSLPRGDVFSFVVREPASIVADKPVQVIQYMRGAHRRRQQYLGDPEKRWTGDPLMLVLPAIEQFGSRLQFNGFERDYVIEPEDFEHFAGVIVKADALENIEVNGVPLVDEDPAKERWVSVPGEGANGGSVSVAVRAADLFEPIANTQYVAANIPVDAGFNLIKSSSPFFGIGWGTYPYESYGFTGSLAVDRVPGAPTLHPNPLPIAALIHNSQEISVRVLDSASRPLSGLGVKFEISGAHAGTFWVMSDAQGWARISYTADSSGDDVIVASLGELEVSWNLQWRTGDPLPVLEVEVSGNQPDPPSGYYLAGEVVEFNATVVIDGLSDPAVAGWETRAGYSGVDIAPMVGTATSMVFPLPGEYVVRATAPHGDFEITRDVSISIRGGGSIRLLSPRQNAAIMQDENNAVSINIHAEVSAYAGVEEVTFFVKQPDTTEVEIILDSNTHPFTHTHTVSPAELGNYEVRARLVDKDGVVWHSNPHRIRVISPMELQRVSDDEIVLAPYPVPFAVEIRGGIEPYSVELRQGPDGTGRPLANFASGNAQPSDGWVQHNHFEWSNPFDFPRGERTIFVRVTDSVGRRLSRAFPLDQLIRANAEASIRQPTAGAWLQSGQDYELRVRVQNLDETLESLGGETPEGGVDLTLVGGPSIPPGQWTETGAGQRYLKTFDYVVPGFTTPVLSGSDPEEFTIEAQPYPWWGYAPRPPPVSSTFTVVPKVLNLGPDITADAGDPIFLPTLAINDPSASAFVLSNNLENLMFRWGRVSGPWVTFDDATDRNTGVTFSGAGVYTLRLEISDGAFTAHEDFTITINAVEGNSPPQLTPVPTFPPSQIQAGPDGASGFVEATASDPDGDPMTIDFHLGGSSRAQFSANAPEGSPVRWDFDGLEAGQYTFRVVARDDKGGTVEAVSGSVTVIGAEEEVDPDAISIVFPPPYATILEPAQVRGGDTLPELTSFELQYQVSGEANNWTTFKYGQIKEGEGNQEQDLGTFDPTMQRNGVYELRVKAGEQVSQPVEVIVEGKQKVGNFAIAFKDLSVPFAGLPIDVIRSYDTRDVHKSGDFGPGWTLSIGATLRKNRPLWKDWMYVVEQAEIGGEAVHQHTVRQSSNPGGVTPVSHLITLSLPDDTVQIFRAEVEVVGDVARLGGLIGAPPADANQSIAFPIHQIRFAFHPHGIRTRGSLRIASEAESIAYIPFREVGTGSISLGENDEAWVSDVFDLFNPTDFIYTADDGTEYLVSEENGLKQITDPTGRKLFVSRMVEDSGRKRISIRQGLDENELVRKVDIVYLNGTNLVDYVQDPSGETINYSYDEGKLERVTDRSGRKTFFRYYNIVEDPDDLHLTHFLKEVLNGPEGDKKRVFFNLYDGEGRLTQQRDFYDKNIGFIRDFTNEPNVEKTMDRLLYETWHKYSDEGNIEETSLPVTDASGGRARITYEFGDAVNPNSVTRKSELLEYKDFEWSPAMVTDYTYDAKGRLLTETVHVDDERLVTEYTYDAVGNLLEVIDPAKNATTYTYYNKWEEGVPDEWHNLPKTITNALGEVTSFENYDDRGNLLRIREVVPNGPHIGVTEYLYDDFDRLIWQRDASGATIDYVYDSQGHLQLELRRVRAINGMLEEVLRTEYLYDKEGRVILTRHPDDTVTGVEYDENGLTKFAYEPITLSPAVALEDFSFTAFGPPTEQTYEAGNRILTRYPPVTIGFDVNDDPITEVYTEEWVYDAENRRIFAKDREDRWTRSYYDPLGRLIATFHLRNFTPGDRGLLNNEERAEALRDEAANCEPILISASAYNEAGQLTDSYDARGFRTHYKYDGAGRRTHVIPPGAVPATIQINATGDGFQPGGSIRENEAVVSVYSSTGNVVEVHGPEEGNVVRHRYDVLNRRVATYFPNDSSTTQTYNRFGHLAASTDAEGKTTRYRYDPIGRLTEVRQYLNAQLAVNDVAMDALRADIGVVSTEYEYDDAGRQIAQVDALDSAALPRRTEYTYDPMGRRDQRILPMDQSESHTYLPDGSLHTRTDFNGETTIYSYDELGRLKERLPGIAARTRGATRAVFSYFPNGQRKAQTLFDRNDAVVWEETYRYDDLGRLDRKTTPAGEIAYSHDAAGKLKSMATSHGTEAKYGYDPRGRLSWVEDRTGVAAEESGRMTNYGFTASGALASAALPNGITHSHYYNETKRLQRITSKRGLANIADFTYDLHPGGHRERLTEAIGREQIQGERRVTNWEYDDLYRLLNESLNGGAGDEQTAIGTVEYTYDKVGNRTSRTVGGDIPLSTYQTVDETYDINDRLTDLDGVTYTHDANGNTRTKNALHLAEDIYDHQNRLIQRLMGEESSIDILYDADGNRVRKTVREGEKEYITHYLVDALNPTGYSQVLLEIGPSQPIKSYTYGLERINQRKHQGGVIHYYGYDGLGSVRYLTDSAGQITEQYTYDAFGNLLDPWPATSPSGNIYRYAGEQWDQDLRLYYNRARYLDPGLGRFWTMDEFEGVNRTPASLHKYLYAHADPVNGKDPSGKFTMTELGGVQVGQNTLRSSKQVVVLGVKKPVLSKLGATLAVNSALLLPFTSNVLDHRGEGEAIIGETADRVKEAKRRRFPRAEIFAWEDEMSAYFRTTLTDGTDEAFTYLLERANYLWIHSVMARGMKIWDIGYDEDRRSVGPFYQLELEWTRDYPNKQFYPFPGSRSF